MMHSTERQLRRLLDADTNNTVDPVVAKHVESCTRCQLELSKLSGVGEWTSELVSHLQSLSQYDRELQDHPPLTTVELHAGASESEEIELDPVSLDFLEPATHPELLGRIGRFDVERVIGSGGMGVVFKAHDGELHRTVAVKVLAPHLAHSAAARKRFAREAQAAAAVIHPNVIPIHNVESDGKLPYLVMQYVAGESLQTRVDRLGPLPITDVLRIAQQTAAGLSAAHSQGLIHRDVKPANILLEESIDRVVLSDFGLARTVDDASLTRTGIVTGTPHYMSPEQAGGESIDCRSDQFSLGCVIYFMLTGRPPFRASTAMGVLNRICHHAHRSIRYVNHSVPQELSQLVDRLLSKSPGSRFSSAEACEAKLSQLLSAVQSGKLQLAIPQKRSRWIKQATAVLALVMCSLLAVGYQYFKNRQVELTNDVTVNAQQKPQEFKSAWSNAAAQSSATTSEIDPAITLMHSITQQAATDGWRRSLQELTDHLDRLEEVQQHDLDWLWFQNRSNESTEEIRAMEMQLDGLERSLEQLPTSR